MNSFLLLNAHNLFMSKNKQNLFPPPPPASAATVQKSIKWKANIYEARLCLASGKCIRRSTRPFRANKAFTRYPPLDVMRSLLSSEIDGGRETGREVEPWSSGVIGAVITFEMNLDFVVANLDRKLTCNFSRIIRFVFWNDGEFLWRGRVDIRVLTFYSIICQTSLTRLMTLDTVFWKNPSCFTWKITFLA